MVFISVALITFACISASYYVWNYCRRDFKQFFIGQEFNLPGPKKLFGNFLRRTPDELLDIINGLTKDYPSPFQISLNYMPFIVIYESNQIKHLCIWTQNREIIAPSFNSIILKEFFDTFVEQSLILAKNLEKVGQNRNKITFLEHMTRCALDIALDAMMGIKIDTNTKDQYVKALVRLKEILRYRAYSTWVLNDFFFFNVIFNLTALGREQRKILKLSSLIIKASDTISITLDFTIFMLSNFPEIQEKIYKELEGIYGTETPISAPVKYDDLQHMHYLDRVIKETMRLFPTVPIIGRELTEDMKIGETVFTKNSNIIIAFIRMYRNEKYWPNPLKFDPDRFLPKRIKECPSYYHIPFSDGPRNCIGIKYATISMKVILSTLVRTFVFKVDKSIEIHKIKLKMDIILSPIKPLKIRIEK